MAMRILQVPDMGDIDGAEVVELLVQPGDSLAVGNPALVLESDKAAFDVPSDVDGQLVRWLVAEGDSVTSGSPLAEVEAEAAPAAAEPESQPPTVPIASEPAPAVSAAPALSSLPVPASPARLSGAIAYAGPGVRRMARELGVELSEVVGSGQRGRIQHQDLQQHVRARLSAPGPAAEPQPVLPDPSVHGDFHIEPLSRMQRAAANNLQTSWGLIPHVTQHDEADVTELEALRLALRECDGVRLTALVFLVRACARVLADFPHLRCWYDARQQQMLVLDYCDIGIAVDTDEGLLVPVLRAVDRRGLADMAADIAALAECARTRRLRPADMRGGCFSISNLGGIGGTAFTPLINLPQVAVLGVSRTRRSLVLDEAGELTERLLMPLSLSYDHRVINGAEAARFVRALCDQLAAPEPLLDFT